MVYISSLDSLLDDFISKMKRGNYDKQEIKLSLCRISDSFRKETGQNEIPINLVPIQKLRKITEIIKRVSRFNQGELIPKTEGFSVILNSKHSHIRNRMTIAHEIGHTLFFDISVMPPKRMITYSNSEEWLCYDFGRCLLMPKEFVKKYVSIYEETPTPKKIVELSNIFEVSKDVFLNRIRRDFQLWNDTTIFLVEANGIELKANKQRYKGIRHTSFTIDGKNGLIYHEKVKLLLQLLQINQEIKEIKEKLTLKNKFYKIEMFRYSLNPIIILCVLRDINNNFTEVENVTTSDYTVNLNKEVKEKIQKTLEDFE